MSISRPALIAFIFVVALLIGFPRWAAISRAKSLLQKERAQVEALVAEQQRLQSLTAQHKASRQRETAARNNARSSAASALDKLWQENPSSAWAEPPIFLPNWEPDSPYVWVSKRTLTNLPFTAFNRDGALNGALADVFMLDAPGYQQLNNTLRLWLENYRGFESERARQTTNHLPGIENGDKLTITVEPLTEEHRKKFEQQFRDTLVNSLGEQRAAMTMELGRQWLAEKFNAFGHGEKTISLVRHPNGTYNLSIRSPAGWSSYGGNIDLASHIPSHLLHYFESLLRHEQSKEE